jgi:muramoyltetrapeptide carboxypeptidase
MSSKTKELKIAIFAPSGPVSSEALFEGIRIVRDEAPGIQVIDKYYNRQLGHNAHFSYLACQDGIQAKIFQELLSDDNISFLWGIRGGYGAIRWLDRISWPEKEKLPLIMGFSDLTFIHSIISSLGGLSIHAPVISTLPVTSKDSRLHLWNALESGIFPELSGIPISSGRSKGHLFGGNLACLVHSLGTPFEPRWDGGILFMEDHNEPLYKIDRMLTQLLLTGRLDRVSGIAAGTFSYESSPIEDVHILLKDRLSSLSIPILTGIPAGHLEENHPMLLGAPYLIDGDNGFLKIP